MWLLVRWFSISWYLFICRNTTSLSVMRHWKWTWHPGSKTSWLRQSHPARAASSASTTCHSSPGSHAVWLSCQGKVPWQPRAHKVGQESTVAGTYLHKSNSSVAWTVCFTRSATFAHFVFSFSIGGKRCGSYLVFLEGWVYCCLSSRAFTSDWHQTAQEYKALGTKAFSSLWLYLSVVERLPSRVATQQQCVPCLSLFTMTGGSRTCNMTLAHALWTDTKHANGKRKDIFFTTYLLSLDFWRCGLPAAPLRQSLHYYVSSFVFVCLCFGNCICWGGMSLGVDESAAALDSELSYCCCLGFTFSIGLGGGGRGRKWKI